MAAKSIFDCDELDESNGPAREREQIKYDDDWFAFGSDATDEVDDALRNVSISMNLTKNGKRKALTSGMDNGRVFKAAKSNGQNIRVTKTNGGPRKANLTHEKHDEYELLKEIGSGTYGRVYKAKMRASNEVIAIKRMKIQLNTENSERNLSFTQREYDNLMEVCDCNYIVRLLKAREKRLGRDNLQLDLLFEYCPYDLKKIIQKTTIRFKLDEIKTFLRQILVGLAYMHKHLIMHRDLKTENILITAVGVVKIADFGLSRKITDPKVELEKKRYTPNVVTQWYRAPELLLGDPHYGHSIDLWSFGCVMGEFWYRQAILQGANEIHQLKLISRLCGPMSPESWPNIVKLAMYQRIGELPSNTRITHTFLKQRSPKVLDDQANNLFDKLLWYNPDKRLTAIHALNDPFFYSDPLPVKTLQGFMGHAIQMLNSQ